VGLEIIDNSFACVGFKVFHVFLEHEVIDINFDLLRLVVVSNSFHLFHYE